MLISEVATTTRNIFAPTLRWYSSWSVHVTTQQPSTKNKQTNKSMNKYKEQLEEAVYLLHTESHPKSVMPSQSLYP